MIPSKTVSNHPKPYWNAELSDLSQQIVKARRKLRNSFTSHNRAKLLRLTHENEDESQLNNIIWTGKTSSDLNEKHSENFSKAVKHFS